MKYLVAGTVVVEAALSAGGGFYDVTILKTGHKFRALAWVFDELAIPYVDLSHERIADENQGNEGTPQEKERE